MSQTKKVLTIAREELEKTEGEQLPKAEVLGMLDNLITALPQAAAMDEQQLDIMVTYMNALNTKMDLLFNATVLCGMGISNDLKVRATIKQMSDKMTAVQNGFDRSLMRIVDPEKAAELDKRDAEVRKAAADNMPGKKAGGSILTND